MIERKMRRYELMVVIRPTVDVTDPKKQEAVIKRLIGETVRIDVITLIGKKPLAYIIEKCTEGIYLLAGISSDTVHSADLEKRMRLGTEVLRYLVVTKE